MLVHGAVHVPLRIWPQVKSLTRLLKTWLAQTLRFLRWYFAASFDACSGSHRKFHEEPTLLFHRAFLFEHDIRIRMYMCVYIGSVET